VALAPHRPGQRFEMQRPHSHASALELRHRRAKASAGGNLDVGRQFGNLERRLDVPRGITDGAEHDENYEGEKGLQDWRGGKITFYDAARAPSPLWIALGGRRRCACIPSRRADPPHAASRAGTLGDTPL